LQATAKSTPRLIGTTLGNTAPARDSKMRMGFWKKVLGLNKPLKRDLATSSEDAVAAERVVATGGPANTSIPLSDSPGSAANTDTGCTPPRKCAVCGGEVDAGLIECPKCGSGHFASEKAHVPPVRGASEAQRPTDTPVDSTRDFSDFRLVIALSQATQQKLKDYPPEMAAAIFLAMTDKNRGDLVERPEGIYISRQCWEKILSYDVWVAADGQIIVTKKGLGRKLEKPKEDAQRFLKRQLPTARKVGRMNSLHYAIGLALEFGLDQNRLLLQKNQNEVEVYY
jgi:hypothetical protein